MYRSFSLTLSIIVASGIVAGSAWLMQASAAEELTSEQKAQLQYFGADPNIMNGGELVKKLSGGCDGNPYQILETKFKKGSDIQLTPKVGSGSTLTDGIDPALACRLVKFLEVAEEKGCRPKLISGYRSVQKQESMCGSGRSGCAAPGRSCHQYGLAVDVASSCIGWMRMAAPQFQLVFPYYGDHIQCAEHSRASCSPNTQPCDGSVKITPDLSRLPRPDQVPDTYYVPPAQTSPTSGLSNQIRQTLGMTPQTTATTQTTQSQSQPQICTPEFSCTGNTMYYQTTSCTKQVYQTCPYGCNGNSCNLSTSTAATTGITISTVLTGTTSESTNTNSNTNTNTDTEATTTQSVSDLLNSYFDPRPVEIGTSTSIVFRLNAETGDIEQLDQRKAVSTLRPAQETISSIQPVNAQQTFTSSDLSGYTSSYYGSTQASGFQKALDNMKAALLWALNVLRPFGGGTVDHQFAP